jgi:putative tricarboxylic transport membrane protein
MLLANIAMLFEEFFGLRFFVRMLRIPMHILLPIIFMLCVVGAFGVNNRTFDCFIVLGFGLIGYFFSKFSLPVAPFIMGFILGPMAETYLRRALMLSSGDFSPFLLRPTSAFFLVVTVLALAFTIHKRRRAASKPGD